MAGPPWRSSGYDFAFQCRAQVRSLVRELRFHLPRGPKHKTNNIVTNSIKTFKMGHTKKVIHEEFPGCQVVKTLCLYCRGQNFSDSEEEGERNIPGHRDSTCEAQSRSGGPEQASGKRELGLTRDPLAEGVRQDQAGDGQTELGRGERLNYSFKKRTPGGERMEYGERTSRPLHLSRVD